MVELEKIVVLVTIVEIGKMKSQGGCDPIQGLLVVERIFVRASSRRVHRWFLVQRIVIISVEQLAPGR